GLRMRCRAYGSTRGEAASLVKLLHAAGTRSDNRRLHRQVGALCRFRWTDRARPSPSPALTLLGQQPNEIVGTNTAANHFLIAHFPGGKGRMHDDTFDFSNTYSRAIDPLSSPALSFVAGG